MNRWFFERSECPSCESKKFSALMQIRYDEEQLRGFLSRFYEPQGMFEPQYLDGIDYVLCQCADCGTVFQKHVPGDVLMERIYEHWIDAKQNLAEHLRLDGLSYYQVYAQEIMQMLAALNREPGSISVFDFGMGWGKWLLMAKAFGCSAYGAELSQLRIAFARGNGVQIISWDEIPSHQFDIINTEQVFEHLPNPLQALAHLRKALKPGGLLKISVPPSDGMKRRLAVMDWSAPRDSRNSLNPVAPLEHINCFPRSAIVRMGQRFGLKEVFVPVAKQIQFSTNWAGLTSIAKNLIRPVRRNLWRTQNYVLFSDS